MFCGLVIVVTLEQRLSKEKVAFDQGRIHVQRSSTVLRDPVPMLHLQVAQRPVGEVGCLVWVFDL